MTSRAAIARAKAPETDVGYANARIRGMKSHFLPAEFYERLISAVDLSHVVKELLETGYRADIERNIVKGIRSSTIDDALKDSMLATYAKVLSLLTPECRTLVNTLVGRWDVFNVKTILRGAHHNVAYADVVDSLMPAGYLGMVELQELARIGDVRAVVDTMATWGLVYAQPLRASFTAYLEAKDLTVLELALDRQYSAWASSRLTGTSDDVLITRRVFAMQVDVRNINTAFRMIAHDVDLQDPGTYFLSGGRSIRPDLFLKMVGASDVDDVLDLLEKTPYHEALDSAASRYVATQSISVFERALEDMVMRKALSAGVGDPHGVGVAISYLWGKENEVTNLRIIAKGKEVGMPADRMRQELILVL